MLICTYRRCTTVITENISNLAFYNTFSKQIRTVSHIITNNWSRLESSQQCNSFEITQIDGGLKLTYIMPQSRYYNICVVSSSQSRTKTRSSLPQLMTT